MKYLLKVWILTCLTMPLLIAIGISANLMLKGNPASFEVRIGLALVLYTAVLGLIFSLPTMIILYLAKKFYTNNKAVFTIISIIGVFISFPLVNITPVSFNYFKVKNILVLIWPISYSIVMTFFIWFLKDKDLT